MTRAIKIKWEKHKERGRCEFDDVIADTPFVLDGELLIKLGEWTGEGLNAVGITRQTMYCVGGKVMVQPVTIRKVVLRK